MMRRSGLAGVAALLAGLLACGAAEPSMDAKVDEMPEREQKLIMPAPEAAGAAAAPPLLEAEEKPSDMAKGEGKMGARDAPNDGDGAAVSDDEPSGAERVRKWFPEAFLWQPMVETDGSGLASVDVRVPDQLTTWRVLGLAHTRDGRQAGSVVTFDSRLVYVDPVVPGWLHAGDRLLMPVQVANTTDAPVTTTLQVEASGPLHGNGGGSVTIVPGGSIVRTVALEADGAGTAKVSAVLSGSDAAIREIPVTPSGRPVAATRGGVVSGEREIAIPEVLGSDPATRRFQVLVFPGPLAVVQAELERGGDASSASNAAYGYAVTTAWRALAEKTGTAVDEKTLRRKQIVAWQRVVPWGRSPDGGTAADLLLGLGGAEDELAVSMRDRLVQTLVSSQNGDGTWTRQSQGTVQQMLVQTALAAHALPESATGARFRAQGAVKRNLAAVRDGYTAAVVLSSGLVEGDARKPLEDLVIGAIADTPAGRVPQIPEQVSNPWGLRPSQAEMAAFCAVALASRTDLPWRGDLVAGLMGGYGVDAGFGAGAADPIALEAVLGQLPGVDRPVEVALQVDGVEVSRAKLDPTQPKVPAVLLARPGAGAHSAKIVVSPAASALAWVARAEDWVAWTGAESIDGIDLEISTDGLKVGRDATLTLTVAAPSGLPVEIVQGLPAGAVVDPASLAAQTDRILEFAVHPDRVEIRTRAFAPGEVMRIPIRVQPAFAGGSRRCRSRSGRWAAGSTRCRRWSGRSRPDPRGQACFCFARQSGMNALTWAAPFS